ncbi:hypothetical protein [uncultured Methanobrevibacter sp.]|uniref:hypothetical protein n=1 Tax=uncultured Methanobrevibacter sp. TaxID=253161 RepID=UPI0025E02A0D|nr:hypothetical protein [uncultured Methanobrevibacter sp.]
MDKKYIVMIVAIIAVLAIGGFFAYSNFSHPESSEQTELFDYSIEPTTSWNADKKEYSFSQSISSVNGKDYKNIDIKVNFYKGNELIGSHDSKIDNTTNGKFNLKFNQKLSEEPDAFYYDVISATET